MAQPALTDLLPERPILSAPALPPLVSLPEPRRASVLPAVVPLPEPDPWAGGRYRIEEHPHGFRILGRDRNPVVVTCELGALRVSYDRPPVAHGAANPFADDARTVEERLGLMEYRKLSRLVGRGLTVGWEPPERLAHWPGAKDWFAQRNVRCVGKDLHRQWLRLLAGLDPTMVAVHRAIFGATFGTAALAASPILYRSPWVVKDILQYRAAAVVACHVEDLVREAAARRIALGAEARAFLACAADAGYDAGQLWDALAQATLAQNTTLDLTSDRLVREMEHWRDLLSPTGRSYRSLDRTLMNLPGGVPAGLVRGLTSHRLSRPITNRLELLMLLAWLRCRNRPLTNSRVIERATADQVKEAMRRVSEHTRTAMTPRRTRDVLRLAAFLADCPEEHRGSLVGLADRSIAWHRNAAAREAQTTVAELGPETQTALPPILPPDVPGVTFLRTVADIAEEGARMDHCIGAYARNAVGGWCYLFHVEHEGECASVEVDRAGRVVQAQGPRNRRNLAADWGARVLSRWVQGWPPDAERRGIAYDGVPWAEE